MQTASIESSDYYFSVFFFVYFYGSWIGNYLGSFFFLTGVMNLTDAVQSAVLAADIFDLV